MPGAPHSDKTFFGLHLCLAGKYCKNPKLLEAQLNVNPAQAITWFVGVFKVSTAHLSITIFNNSFYAAKYFLKKLATVRGMLIGQIFELRGHGPPGRICTPIPGCFHDKTIISKKNIRLDCCSLLKHCRRQCTLLPPS